MKKPGKGQDTSTTESKAQPSQEGATIQLERLLKQFAYQPIYFSADNEEAEKARALLQDLLKDGWKTCGSDLAQKGSALIEWILLCPPLYQGQPGFEWVREEFFRLLMQRLRFWDLGQRAVRDAKGRLVGVDDQLFWEIIKNVRGKLNRGHPSSVVKDYARSNRVMFFMMFKKTATGKQITEPEAVEMVARYEVRQRVLNGERFLTEVGGLSKREAQRIVSSWGIDQRDGAISFLMTSGKLTPKDAEKKIEAEKMIDDWNRKEKRRRAKEFLETKLGYTDAKAQSVVNQWKFDDETESKDVIIRSLVKEHGCEEVNAQKIVHRWGNTGNLELADPSPISRSLKVVKAQGLWVPIGEGTFSNKEEAQKVMDLLLKQINRKPKKGKNEFSKKEEDELKRLTTKLWKD
jgi:hypothetical protein